MTSIFLRKTSVFAATALSSAAAMAFASPAFAGQSGGEWHVAQTTPAPQLTDEEKKRLDELKKRGERGERQQKNGAPQADQNSTTPPQGDAQKAAPKGTMPVKPPVVQQNSGPKPFTKPAMTPPPSVGALPKANTQIKTETPPVVNEPVTPPDSAKTQPQVKTLNPSNPSPPQRRRPDYDAAKSPPVGTPPLLAKPTLDTPASVPNPLVIPPTKQTTPFVKNLEQAKTGRVEKVEDGGKRVVIREADKRTIVKQGGKIIIQKDEAAQLRRVAPGAVVTRNQLGSNTAVVNRPNNVQIITETDRSGQLVRRFRRDGSGRETEIIDNRRRNKNFGRNLAIGAGIVAGAAILNSVVDVPPPVVRIPRDKYVLRYDDASEDDIYEALSAPPVDRIDRGYTLDQVRATPYLRDRMRRIDLDDINFEFGSWEVDPNEYRKLERIARAMMRVIDRNPNEVFLIEGYTDAVGSDVDNLTLSDRRAESVSVVLSEQFQVPFENLTTQGYGEQYLKVDTDGPERINRRVAVRRITPLLSQEQSDASPPPPPRDYEDRDDDSDRYRGRRWRNYGRYR